MPLEHPASEGEVFTLSRSFDCSPQLLWDVWTKPDHLTSFFSPPGMTTVVKTLDLKVGGLFMYGMQMAGGVTMWGKWVYREIEAPDAAGRSRLAYVVSFCNEAGQPVRHPMAPLWPLEVLAEQVITGKEGKALLETRSYPINATAEERAVFKAGHASMQMGFAGTLAQLDAYLAALKGK